MAEKTKIAETIENVESTVENTLVFTKEQLRDSNKFAKNTDVIGVVLEEDRTYTVEECEKLINSFLNRKCERRVK